MLTKILSSSPQNNEYSSSGGRSRSSTSSGFKSHVDAESADEQLGVARVLKQFRLHSLCSGGDVVILSKNVSATPFRTIPQFQKLNPYGKRVNRQVIAVGCIGGDI